MVFQVVHGLSVPLGKAGYHIPRTISSALSEHEPVCIPSRNNTHSTATTPVLPGLRFNRTRTRTRNRDQQQQNPERDMPARTVFPIGNRGSANAVIQEACVSSSSLQNSASAAAAVTGQQLHERGQEHTVLNQVGTNEQAPPSVQASNAVHEPRRPVRLLGEDGRVTETLNASE